MGTGRGRLRRVLGQPMLHFLLIGIAVFTLYRLVAPPESAAARAVITVTPAEVARLDSQFETVWRRPPTDAERAGLIDEFVREEVYYREALALGLDRDDTVIRRRLRQKMEFLADSGAGAPAPTEAELRAFFESHLDRFVPAARITFRQVFLGDAEAAPALAALAAGADPATLGQATLLPPVMEAAVGSAVDATFGDGFFRAVAALGRGGWQGPVASAFGAHLVQLVESEPAVAPPFEAVREAVAADWQRQAAEDRREAGYRALRDRYEVVVLPAADPAR